MSFLNDLAFGKIHPHTLNDSRLAPVPESVIMSQTLHDQDLYDWSMQTAWLLREGRYAEIDTLHLAEEVESMGKSERRAVGGR